MMKATEHATPRLSSCRDFVLNGTKDLSYIDGHLSLEFGFLPPKLPISELPKSHQIWDDMANQIPQLFFSNQTQTLIERMPVLAVKDLAPEYWSRAAVVLSLLASAYWRHGMPHYLKVRTLLEDASLPPSIDQPWREVTELLNRGTEPYQSVRDLFFNNFKFFDPEMEYSLKNIQIENIDMLVPSFGNEAERVFYLSFVETHSQSGTLVSLVCDLDDVIEQNNNLETAVPQVIELLNSIAQQIDNSLRGFMKISPVERSKTYCDPVLWSKTIGVYALPPANYVQGGTSGTSVPILYVFDALIGRKKFDSYYGEYVQDTSYQLLDKKAQQFVQRVSQIGLKDWIVNMDAKTNGHQKLVEAFNHLVESYSGQDGFLDKHTSKAFNYLGIGTLVGRNQSTSGHERYIRSETWKMVCEELKISQGEREKLSMADMGKMMQAQSTSSNQERPHNEASQILYKPEEVARHYRRNDGWIIIDGYVYDVTDYIDKHPGGRDIISAYLGRNASEEFNQISSHGRTHVERMLTKLEIGQLSQGIPSVSFMKYENLIYELQRIHAILDMQRNREEADKKTSLLFHLQAQHAFVQDHMVTVLDHLGSGQMLDQLPEDALTGYVKEADLRHLNEEELAEFYETSLDMLALNMQLVEDLLHMILVRNVTEPAYLFAVIIEWQMMMTNQYDMYWLLKSA